MRIKKLFQFATVLSLMLWVGTASAQNAPTSTPPGATSTPPHELTVEEAIDFRNQILDLFGIPHNIPLTIYDFMSGNTKDFALPHTGLPKADLGPLQDLKLVVNETDLSPGRRVEALVVSFSTNLQTATITWYHNGVRVSSGKGNVLYTFTLGAEGATDSLRAAVTANTGEYKEVSRTLRPARIHFTWFTNTYTPAWYRGKALPSPGSDIVIVAVPDFRIGKTRLASADLIYEWSLNNSTLAGNPNISGRGKNTYTLKLSTVEGAPYTLGVRVSDGARRVASEERIEVHSTRPQVIPYVLDSLYGVKMWLAGNNFAIPSGDAISLIAEPYFIPKKDVGGLDYTWRVNGNTVPGDGGGSNRIFQLVSEPGSFGRQTVNVSFENKKNVFQRGVAETVINVVGGGDTSNE